MKSNKTTNAQTIRLPYSIYRKVIAGILKEQTITTNISLRIKFSFELSTTRMITPEMSKNKLNS
jgi:hypothetical protein